MNNLCSYPQKNYLHKVLCRTIEVHMSYTKKLFQYICHTQKSITLMIRDTAVLKIDLFSNQRKPNKDIQTFPNSKR